LSTTLTLTLTLASAQAVKNQVPWVLRICHKEIDLVSDSQNLTHYHVYRQNIIPSFRPSGNCSLPEHDVDDLIWSNEDE
jgi:hypothetical protein